VFLLIIVGLSPDSPVNWDFAVVSPGYKNIDINEIKIHKFGI
jgi:hypothetical protein